ncbi:MAG: lipooligosaccharide transport system permease protein [Frankiaceae bacterium]|jgi:lipooligosaccharide transport system permease protein|nr:lipooligosaccharide transport system permease protein [Frankiaceae bacterium]
MALRAFSYHWLLYRRTWRGSIVIGLVNPLLFLTGIGIGIGKLIDSGGGNALGVPYLAFLAPGMLAASAMQMAFGSSGFAVFFSAEPSGSYTAAAATPLDPTDILLGHQLFTAFRVALLSSGYVIVQVLLGAARSPLVVLTIPAAALTGAAFAGPAAAWSITAKRFTSIEAMFRFVIQPLYFLSGTFFSLATAPAWVRTVAYLSPLWHGVELCRALSLGRVDGASLAGHVAFLAAVAIAGLAAAVITYRRRLHP